MRRYFAKFFVARGRASPSEYWWVQGAFLAAFVVLGALLAALDSPTGAVATACVVVLTVLGVALLVLALGSIALSIRRLHDANASGWWFLLVLVVGAIPLLGLVAMVVVGVLPSRAAGARFDSRGAPEHPSS